MKCPKCQYENDADAKFCEKCGSSIKSEKKEGFNQKTKILIGVCVILVIVLGVSVGYILKGNPANNGPITQSSTQISASNGFPVSEAPNLASELSKNNGNIANIQYKGVTLDKYQCFYIMAKSIVMINRGEGGYIPIKSVSSPESPYGVMDSAVLTKSEYIDMADRTYKWIDTNSQAPNYVGITTPGVPDLSPDLTFKAFIKALTQYKNSGQLPQSITTP